MDNDQGFDGAKVAVLLGDQLPVILRDNTPGLAFAGCWDLPGGGREGNETPFECVRRECVEELGLALAPQDIRWQRGFERPTGTQWFFVAHQPVEVAKRIVLGDEGQRWQLMRIDEYVNHPIGIPRLQRRLQLAVQEGASQESPPLT